MKKKSVDFLKKRTVASVGGSLSRYAKKHSPLKVARKTAWKDLGRELGADPELMTPNLPPRSNK
jgi:hypothetical protein